MKIRKTDLADLEKVYAVNTIDIDGQIHLLTATEDKGKCLLLSPPDWNASVIWEAPGGTMNVLQYPNKEAILSIQKFFPIFDSQDACIMLSEIDKDKTRPWNTHKLADLPYVHRIGAVAIGRSVFVVAATLCRSKKFVEDWSQPGSVYIGKVNEETSTIDFKEIISCVTKNHGMHISEISNKKTILTSSEKGVYATYIPNDKNGEWISELIIDRGVSDIYTIDIDNDGDLELAAIEPFHGDIFSIYKQKEGVWEKIYQHRISFGHVVWGGKILGEPCIILGTRSGAKELEILQPIINNNKIKFKSTVIDSNIGPTQIKLFEQEGKTLVLSANHFAGKVSLYEITN